MSGDDDAAAVKADRVANVVLVLSGKGGVGKSMTASRLAVALHRRGLRVGFLDVDLCGPSAPRIFGVADRDVHNCSQGWVPVYVDGAEQRLSVMSIGFLLKSYDSDAVVWRGPKKNAMVKQFLTDVTWGDLDYLVVDTPPGTSDEHISVVEAVKDLFGDSKVGAVLVTTPQAMAVDDVRREIAFCRKTRLSIIGLVENMSGFVCPNCDDCSNVFSKGGGRLLAERTGVGFLGEIPLDPRVAATMDAGGTLLEAAADDGRVEGIVEGIIASGSG